LEVEREEGGGGDSDGEGEEVLVHDEARVESTEERREDDKDIQNLEDKDDNYAILARNNMYRANDPGMRLNEPPPEWVPTWPKLDQRVTNVILCRLSWQLVGVYIHPQDRKGPIQAPLPVDRRRPCST
jgi:hypothetical protein